MAPKRVVRGYELQERVGAGGFGEVYRAYQPAVGRQVAIKIILPQYATHPEFIRRFEAEARLVARLEHPHIVPLYDYWRDADTERAYLVMRWLAGGNLYESLRRGSWDIDAAARLLDQAAGALDVAHRQGVVHRDVKPENILLDEDGNAYLSDFGIAKDLVHAVVATAPEAVPGSLWYISPEQAQSQPVTPQSDLYSLGLVMYEVLTGEHPFHGLTPPEQLIRRLTEPLPPLEKRRPDLPAALDAVMQRATAKEPAERYPSALAFAAAFREALTDAIREPAPIVLELAPQLPDFLQAEVKEVERPVFVARERELARLNEFLNKALSGQCQVVFVTGGPGRGKTALLAEFARRAMESHPNLLAASGSCNAYSGVGDPYLPFRDVMAMLTGDVQSLWAAGAISHDHAQRLWAAIPLTVQALMSHGPHLVDIVFSGEALLSRATAAAGAGVPWVEQLREYVKRQRARSTELEQSHLFQQVTNVMHALAEEHPLLLVLDDLQWVDSASASLLFHLGRRLAGTRILIACAYRPEEVTLGRDGQRHPLEKVLAEFKQHFGDVWVNLAQIEQIASREFVDAFLATEPNLLTEDFRQALYAHTGGHPLFTIELLRAMQDRGDLKRDSGGRWVVARELDWTSLPARVEGVIEERIGRLEDDLRDVLSVASVEGETFTAQVVARVQEIGERQLLRKLSQELEKRHRLVVEQGDIALEKERLSRFRFAHTLFQQFLYRDLGDGERAYLHREIGSVLEKLYEGSLEEIAVQLVHHFHFAGDLDREAHYARLAGEQAAVRYANAEALRYFSRALELTPETRVAERYILLLAREKVYDLLGERQAEERDLTALQELVDTLSDSQKRADVSLLRAHYARMTGDYLAAIEAARQGVALAQEAADAAGEARAHLAWARALLRQGDYDATTEHLSLGLDPARALRLARLVADAQQLQGTVAFYRGDHAEARRCFEQAMLTDRQSGSPRGEANVLNNLGAVAGDQGDLPSALGFFNEVLTIKREIGDRTGEGLALNNLGVVARDLGDYPRARTCLEKSLVIYREITFRQGEVYTLNELGNVTRYQGDFAGAQVYYDKALAVAQEIGDRRGEGYALTGMGNCFAALQQWAEAAAAFQRAVNLRQELDQPHLAIESRAGLAAVALAQGDLVQAQNHVATILAYLDEGNSMEGADEPLYIYLICYRVLRPNGELRADEILDTAYGLLQERAAKITNQEMRRSYLENVAAHRELVTEYAELRRGAEKP